MKDLTQPSSHLPYWKIGILVLFPALLGWQFEWVFNESDVLALAMHCADPNWAKGDWYLGLPGEYRILFNALTGHVIKVLGTAWAIPLLRALFLIAFGWVISCWLRSAQLAPSALLWALFFHYRNQSFLAEEWMYGGIETKALAYVLLLLALFAMHRQYPWLTGLSAGLALSFHVLVGFFGGCSLLLVLILQRKSLGRLAEKWPSLLLSGLIGGSFGLFFIGRTLLAEPIKGMDAAWDIYVHFRVPHHLLPNEFPVEGWLYFGCFIALHLLSFLWVRSDELLGRLRLLSLCSLLFFAIGGMLFWTDQTQALRYYWFRLSDALLPFTSFLLVGALLSQQLPQWTRNWPKRSRRIGSGILFLGPLLLASMNTYDRWTNSHSSYIAQHDHWIVQETDPSDVFLIDPAHSNFYFTYQRPQYVSFKHFPQEAGAIIEWRRRLENCAGDRWPTSQGMLFRKEIGAAYNSLKAEHIERLCKEENIQYALFSAYTPIKEELPLAYRDDRQVIYGPFGSGIRP